MNLKSHYTPICVKHNVNIPMYKKCLEWKYKKIQIKNKSQSIMASKQKTLSAGKKGSCTYNVTMALGSVQKLELLS